MTDREEYAHQARRADLDGNPLRGILLGCGLGSLLWLLGMWTAGWLR